MIKKTISVFIFTIMLISVCVLTAAAEDNVNASQTSDARFPDVPTSHWAYSSIMTLVDRGVVSGYADGLFRPDTLVSRSEFALMMARTLQIPLIMGTSPAFVDVGENDWDFVYVESVKKYLTGYQQGDVYYFRGNEKAVREDMAVALVKALGLENQQADVNDLQNIFTDYETISPNLQKYVLLAYNNNLIGGYPDGTFRAQQSITRAETASLLIKVLNSDAAQKVTFGDETEVIAEETGNPKGDYKEGNGLVSYNKVYQVGEWIYFAEYEVIYRINVNGAPLEKLFVADLGLMRGAGAHGLAQCGEYLVFTQGSYIYKLNLATLKTEVLISAKNENTCFEFAVNDGVIYFVGTEGSFIDGIYKINIDGNQPEKILDDERCWNIQIYNNQVFFSIPYRGLYCVDLNGANKKQILGSENVGWESFIVTGGYIYFLKDDYSLQRADIDGQNITQLADSCKAFIIRNDYIFYSKLAVENNFYFGTSIYKVPINKKEPEQIYKKDAELYGSCGDWIYFMKPSSSAMLRVRLDGTGEMLMHD